MGDYSKIIKFNSHISNHFLFSIMTDKLMRDIWGIIVKDNKNLN